MIYFDTDVLIHYLVEQDSAKHLQAIQLFEQTSENGLFFLSLLCLEEAAFVLAKLKVDASAIDTMVDRLLPYATVGYNRNQFLRAKELAGKVGFHNMNDCLHTAIAETYCTQIYTFNKSDFKSIQPYTTLTITLLEATTG
jgi:predicted nucleic acid-binding protein